MLVKNMLKKIGHSFGRFASLVAIILIGVGFYAGIRQSTPAIRDAENRFALSTNMMDLHVVSTLGFTDTDIERIESLNSVEMVTSGYSKYVYSGDNVLRVLSIDNDINKFYKWDGKYPVKDNECLADSMYYKVGDTITIRESAEEKGDDEDILTEHTFTVVGTVTSPIYMGSDYGSANIGNGELYSYILIKRDVFDLEAYTDVYITTAKTDEDIPYSDSYKEKLDALKEFCADEKRPYVEEILKAMMAESRRYQADHPLEYGLLGRVLGHSHSPQIHKMLGGYDYGLFEREPDQLDAFFEDSSWRGISVTMPYKRDVMKYCDELSDTAARCNSVNTIVRKQTEEGLITVGHNTDYDGFRYIVEKSGMAVSGAKTLVLGSGGVSGTVVQVMKDLGADPVVIISRSGEDNYENLDRHRGAKIIVNTTPVGMYPKAGESALDIREFPQCKAVYDLIYNPLRTKLMLDAEEAGIPTFGGLPMLVAQAAKAVEMFGYPLLLPIEKECETLQESLENLVLIGMPGAGKTTTGRALAEKTGKRFLDLDQVITQHQERTPEEIIRSDGVDRFRRIENEVLEALVRGARTGGLVLACGGGVVEREGNRQLLRENGRVIWLCRDISELPTEGRPVSQTEGLERLLERRRPAYESWSDFAVLAVGPQPTALRILEEIKKRSQEKDNS